MSGAPIEDMLDLWPAELRAAEARLRALFARPGVATSASAFLDGLLGPERRETGWLRAEAAGDPGPWGQRAVLGRSRWDADALRDLVRDHALEALAAPDAVLVIGETGFLEQGKASCGVGRQCTGSAGKIADCQGGVFAAYVPDAGHAFIDRRLYLPEAWTDAPARPAAAHVPAGAGPATEPRLAADMVESAGVPFASAAADSVYGAGEVETTLRRAGKGHVLGVAGRPPLPVLGQAARRERHGGGDRGRVAGPGLHPPPRRGGHQGATLLRLGLPGAGRPRRRGRGLSRQPRPLDPRPADPAQPRRWRARLLLDLVPGRHAGRGAGERRGAALGDRGRVRGRQD
jgi:hypothetical protein